MRKYASTEERCGKRGFDSIWRRLTLGVWLWKKTFPDVLIALFPEENAENSLR
jgi:hypothetical protein